jgi:hypothetical protein
VTPIGVPFTRIDANGSIFPSLSFTVPSTVCARAAKTGKINNRNKTFCILALIQKNNKPETN